MYNYKIRSRIFIGCGVIGIMFLLWLVFGGDDSPAADEAAIALAQDALRMVDECRDAQGSREVTHSLLSGIGYIISLCVPVGLIVYFLHVCGKR
jgi:hypothetical protein